MNIIDLKRIVDSVYEHTKEYNRESTTVGIEVKRFGVIGGTPVVDIKSIVKGFDFDNNKVIIYPEVTLREIDRDEIKTIQDKYEELGWNHYEISGLKRENKRLKEEINKLKAG